MPAHSKVYKSYLPYGIATFHTAGIYSKPDIKQK